MDDLHTLLDFPSPSNSQYYMYGDAERHLDASTSESQSPINSPYDMCLYPDASNISCVYPSPEGDEEEEEEEERSKTSKPAAKRKRENRYKNAPPAVLSRRRAQNRASQRAYRERKDQRIKDLEAMLNDAKQKNDELGQAYAILHAEYVQLKNSRRREQQLQGLPPSSYGTADLGFDPTMGTMTGAGSDRMDMELFMYPGDASNYSL